MLPLPVISNGKTVDPRDKASTKVLQLETAMGSAIECFPGAQVTSTLTLTQPPTLTQTLTQTLTLTLPRRAGTFSEV